MAGTRRELRAQGEALRAKLFGAGQAAAPLPSDAAPGFRALMSEAAYGALWCRPGLPIPDRMVCTLAALCAVQRPRHLTRYAGAALDVGMKPAAVIEVFIQVGIYAGFAASEDAIELAAAVFEERGAGLPATLAREDSLETLTARGNDILQRLHGARGRLGYAAPDNPLTSELYPLAIQYGYGEIWSRPGLELRERALCAVAAFTALRMQDQLGKFGQSALNAGLTRAQVVEAVIQTAPYSGYAPALNALRWLSEVL